MSAFLRRTAWLRAAVGIVAAYTLAIQMFLGGMAATQMAAADPAGPFVICYGSHSNDDDQGKSGTRIHHASCVVCALASFAPPIPEAAPAPIVAGGAVSVVHPGPQAPPFGIGQHHNPRSSQGPPQAS